MARKRSRRNDPDPDPRRRRRARRNAAAYPLYETGPSRRPRKRGKRRSRKGDRGRVRLVVKRRSYVKKTRSGRRVKRYSKRSILVTARRNPVVMGLPLPTVQQLLWVGVGALGLPFVTKTVTGLIPVDAVKSGYGNIATEFVIGAAASVAARKFVGSTAGDVLFILTLARAVGRVAYQINPAIGFAGDESASMGVYEPGQMAVYEPGQLGYTENVPGFGDVSESDGVPEAA